MRKRFWGHFLSPRIWGRNILWLFFGMKSLLFTDFTYFCWLIRFTNFENIFNNRFSGHPCVLAPKLWNAIIALNRTELLVCSYLLYDYANLSYAMAVTWLHCLFVILLCVIIIPSCYSVILLLYSDVNVSLIFIWSCGLTIQ